MDVLEAFQYCPRCAHKFKRRKTYNACPACGLYFYHNPKPANAVVLQNIDGDYLFVRRADEPSKGFLDLPGGFVEGGESFEEGARRELKEELGIEVETLNYLCDLVDSYLYQGINYTTIGLAYLGKLPASAKLKASDDVASFEFYSLEAIPKDQLAFSSMHKIIDALAEHSKR